MRVLLLVALGVLLLAGGCTSAPLEAEWAPLVRVEQDPMRLVGESMVTTVLDTLFVRDLGAFEAAYPVGSVARRGLCRHETEHARRQAAMGVLWFYRYLTDKDFRWAEEQIGWRFEIEERMAGGEQPVPEKIADVLSQHYRRMVSRADALAWVLSVVAGR